MTQDQSLFASVRLAVVEPYTLEVRLSDGVCCEKYCRFFCNHLAELLYMDHAILAELR
ncbi:hypothetical protein PMIT1342_00469 [Prochlorococcus marinus str. MIT 1342]|nr:hypothetical protein PMIT1342_00469 [Prochlorococcus marinus str. MIT 1342]